LNLIKVSVDANSKPIPTQIGLTNLKSLSISNGKGNLPSTTGLLTKLTHLNLADNELKGKIPFSLGSLTNLKYLSFSYNKLSGTIPFQLGLLPQLTELSGVYG
jgi:Leucine Rich repeats (2 copies)